MFALAVVTMIVLVVFELLLWRSLYVVLFLLLIYAHLLSGFPGDMLVAMEALYDRLTILGYELELRRRGKPPLSRYNRDYSTTVVSF